MGAEALTFAGVVRESVTRSLEEQRTRVETRLPGVQAEYDANYAVITKLGIEEQFDVTAQNIREVTGKSASVTVSRRPTIGPSDIDPKCLDIKGASDCSVTLEWEPSGTMGVKHSIVVRVFGEHLYVRSAKPPGVDKFAVATIDITMLDKSLIAAYQHPLGSTP